MNTSPTYIKSIFTQPERELLAKTERMVARAIARSTNHLPSEGISESLVLNHPTDVKAIVTARLQHLSMEVMDVLFLDAQHRVRNVERLSLGTIDGASVYPRVIVKAALQHDAHAIILAHNHPSGVPTPSEADRRITMRINEALAFIDVRLLDHMIVAGTETCSMSENGLL